MFPSGPSLANLLCCNLLLTFEFQTQEKVKIQRRGCLKLCIILMCQLIHCLILRFFLPFFIPKKRKHVLLIFFQNEYSFILVHPEMAIFQAKLKKTCLLRLFLPTERLKVHELVRIFFLYKAIYKLINEILFASLNFVWRDKLKGLYSDFFLFYRWIIVPLKSCLVEGFGPKHILTLSKFKLKLNF